MYVASDLAGTMKLQYDISSRIIRMPCTARLDINFILKALQEGADGVLVVGCHPRDCAYKTRNPSAERRVRFARELVKQLGLNKDRVKMVFVSAADGDKFATEISKFADEVRRIGQTVISLKYRLYYTEPEGAEIIEKANSQFRHSIREDELLCHCS